MLDCFQSPLWIAVLPPIMVKWAVPAPVDITTSEPADKSRRCFCTDTVQRFAAVAQNSQAAAVRTGRAEEETSAADPWDESPIKSLSKRCMPLALRSVNALLC